MSATVNNLDQAVATCNTILAQCVVAANEAAAAAAYIEKANPAPLNSPAFTGVPTAPTAVAGTNSAQIATTQYLDRLLGAAMGIPTLDNTGHIPTAQLPSSVTGGLAFQGVWNATTNTPTIVSGTGTNGYFYVVQVAGTTTIDGNSTWNVGDWIVFQDGGTNKWGRVAPTYTPIAGIALSSLAVQAAYTFVANSTGSSASPTAISETTATSLLNVMVGDSGSGGTKGLVGAPAAGDAAAGKYWSAAAGWSVPPGSVTMGDLAAYALLANPAFTGTPTATTQAVDTNSTALATCAFVIGQLSSSGDGTPAMDGTAARGVSTHGARADHVHPSDTSRAPIVSPTFTGTPAAPTPAVDTNTTQIPTCAFVLAQLSASGDGTPAMDGVAARGTSTHGARADHVHPSDTSRAPLTSPGLLGTPTAPTPAGSDNSTAIATTAYVKGQGYVTSAGQPIPTSSTFAVGTLLLCAVLSPFAGTVADGATTSGANIGPYVGTVNAATALAGTWKNVSGQTFDPSSGERIGYFVRTA